MIGRIIGESIKVNSLKPRPVRTSFSCVLVVVYSSVHLLAQSLASEGSDGLWIADANGTWGDAGNWAEGIIAEGPGGTADFSNVDITENKRVEFDQDRHLGNLFFGASSGDQSWTVAPEAGNAEDEEDSGAILSLEKPGETPVIDVEENGLVYFERRLDGSQGFRKSGSGVLVLTNPAHNFTGDVIVEGGILRILASGETAVGAGSDSSGENEINVKEGATFELGPEMSIRNKHIHLSGTGVKDPRGDRLGAFYANASGTTNTTRWSFDGEVNPAITLDADATIRIDGDGIDGPDHSAALLIKDIDLNGNTLSKKVTGRIDFQRPNPATGEGTLAVEEGVVVFRRDAVRDGVDLFIGEAGETWGMASDPLNAPTNTVTVNGRMVMSARTDTSNSEQNIGVLQGNGLITSGIFGNTGSHKLIINHLTEDSTFGGVIEEAAGTISVVKGASPVRPEVEEEGDEEDEAASTLTLNGPNTYSGDTIINSGGLVLGTIGGLTFYIGGDGETNRIRAGDGANGVFLKLYGEFGFDLSEASTFVGDSWSLVDVENIDTTLCIGSFRVAGFKEVDDGIWGTEANGVKYQLTEETLTLEVVEEFTSSKTGFEFWAFELLAGQPEALRAPTADPDGDGVNNLLEYAFDGHPLSPFTATLPSVDTVTEEGKEFLQITFTRVDSSDLLYQVQTTESLDAEWEEIWSSKDQPFTENQETVRDNQSIHNMASRFIRLKVKLLE